MGLAIEVKKYRASTSLFLADSTSKASSCEDLSPLWLKTVYQMNHENSMK